MIVPPVTRHWTTRDIAFDLTVLSSSPRTPLLSPLLSSVPRTPNTARFRKWPCGMPLLDELRLSRLRSQHSLAPSTEPHLSAVELCDHHSRSCSLNPTPSSSQRQHASSQSNLKIGSSSVTPFKRGSQSAGGAHLGASLNAEDRSPGSAPASPVFASPSTVHARTAGGGRAGYARQSTSVSLSPDTRSGQKSVVHPRKVFSPPGPPPLPTLTAHSNRPSEPPTLASHLDRPP